LIFRELTADDAPALAELISDPDAWIQTRQRHLVDHGYTHWGLFDRVDDSLKGFCGFLTRAGRGTTLGYGVLSADRGVGLATEAAEAACVWAIERGIDFYASIRPPNPPSVRVLVKLGFLLVDHETDESGAREIYRIPAG
jgi:RimJ/RimL family protein N-acetyltransferase